MFLHFLSCLKTCNTVERCQHIISCFSMCTYMYKKWHFLIYRTKKNAEYARFTFLYVETSGQRCFFDCHRRVVLFFFNNCWTKVFGIWHLFILWSAIFFFLGVDVIWVSFSNFVYRSDIQYIQCYIKIPVVIFNYCILCLSEKRYFNKTRCSVFSVS